MKKSCQFYNLLFFKEYAPHNAQKKMQVNGSAPSEGALLVHRQADDAKRVIKRKLRR